MLEIILEWFCCVELTTTNIFDVIKMFQRPLQIFLQYDFCYERKSIFREKHLFIHGFMFFTILAKVQMESPAGPGKTCPGSEGAPQ